MFGVRQFKHQFNSLNISTQQQKPRQHQRRNSRQESDVKHLNLKTNNDQTATRGPPEVDQATSFRQRLRIRPRRQRLKLVTDGDGDDVRGEMKAPRPRPSRHAPFRDKSVRVVNAHYENRLENVKVQLRTSHDRALRQHEDEVNKLEYQLRLMQFDLQRNALTRAKRQCPERVLENGLEERRLQNRAKYLAYDPRGDACSYLSKKNAFPCRSRSRSVDDTSATLREARQLLASRNRHYATRASLPDISDSGMIRERARTRGGTLLPGDARNMADAVLARKRVELERKVEFLEERGQRSYAYLSPKLLKFYLKPTPDELEGPGVELLRHWDENGKAAFKSSTEYLRWDPSLNQFLPSI